MIVGGKFQEAGMEMNGVTATLQDHAPEIVGLQAPGCSAPVVKGMHVAEGKVSRLWSKKNSSHKSRL